jgi:hypothetical protein
MRSTDGKHLHLFLAKRIFCKRSFWVIKEQIAVGAQGMSDLMEQNG